jgi:DNA-binding response OmpR family regulator
MAGMVAPREASRRALIVEDEASLREIVRFHLSLAGFETEEVADGRTALDLVRTDRFDLVVLDVMLPGVDGVTICRAIRSGGPNQRSGVLMLTARDTEPDKVIGLESGADDYLTKPFGVREFMARVTSVVRRSSGELTGPDRSETGTVTSADVTLDPDRRQARVRGELVGIDPAGIRHPVPARLETRHRVQPGRAHRESVGRPYLRHRAHGRRGRQSTEAQG